MGPVRGRSFAGADVIFGLRLSCASSSPSWATKSAVGAGQENSFGARQDESGTPRGHQSSTAAPGSTRTAGASDTLSSNDVGQMSSPADSTRRDGHAAHRLNSSRRPHLPRSVVTLCGPAGTVWRDGAPCERGNVARSAHLERQAYPHISWAFVSSWNCKAQVRLYNPLMLLRLRVVLALLLMAAIPLQGFAAATMLFCAAATHTVSVRTQHASEQLGRHQDRSSQVADAGVTQSQASAGGDVNDDCALCASCCHNVAIAEPLALAAAQLSPAADLIEPFVLVVSEALPLPDRPPRA